MSSDKKNLITFSFGLLLIVGAGLLFLSNSAEKEHWPKWVQQILDNPLIRLTAIKSPVYALEDQTALELNSALSETSDTSDLSATSFLENRRTNPFLRKNAVPSEDKKRRNKNSSASESQGEEDFGNKNSQGAYVRDLPVGLVDEEYCQYLNPQWGRAPYQWQRVGGNSPTGINLDTTSGYFCGTPRAAGVFAFDIKITDGAKNFITVRYNLVVTAFLSQEGSDPFNITTDRVPGGLVGTDYLMQFSTTGGALPHSWNISFIPPGLNFESRYGMLYGIPLNEGQYSFNVSARDGHSVQASKAFVLPVQTSPLYATTSSLTTGVVGLNYFEQLRAQGGRPPYTWQVIAGIIPTGLTFNSQGILTGTALNAEAQTLRFQVMDRDENTDSVELRLNVTSGALNINTESLTAGAIGLLYYTQLLASGGVPPYQWQISNGQLPNGLNFQSSGVMLGTSTQSGDFLIQVEVADQTNTRIQKNLNLRIDASPLQITTSSLPDAHVAIEYFQQLEAQGGTPPYVWQIQPGGLLPVGMSLSSTGILSGTPQTTAIEYFTVMVTDGQEHSDSNPYTLVVNTETLTVLTDILPTARSLQNYHYQLQALGGTPPYTWTKTSGDLPLGLTFESNGTISGIPQDTGIFPFNVRVTDTQNHFGTKPLHVAVIERDLRITTSALPEATVGVPYNFELTAEGGISPYEWAYISGGLPGGLLLDRNSGMISGTPTQAGNTSITFMVEDTLYAQDLQGFDLRVRGTQLMITTTTLGNGQLGVSYQQNLTVQGGTPPYHWTIIGGGNLPTGLILGESSGVISGMPTQIQTAQFTVHVEDGQHNQDVLPLSIRIDPQPLTITTTSLPNGQVNVPYNEQLAVVGGTPPYVWEIIQGQGQLPSGLNWAPQTGSISGTPTAVVTNLALIFKVTDSANFTTRNLNLTIQPSGIIGFIAQGSNQKIGLAWVNPTDPQFRDVKVVRNMTRIPQDPTDGVTVYSGTNNNMVDSNLTNDTTYYYAAFAYDLANNFVPPGSGGQGTATPHAVTLSGPNDPFADQVITFNPLNPGNCFGFGSMPNVVLGPPNGAGEYTGSLDVVSFHAKVNNDSGASAPYGGSVVLKFNNNIVVNGTGVDFTIFENAFHVFNTTGYFIEPAVVDVSYDGVHFYRFPFDFVPHFTQSGPLDLQNPFAYPTGFAGVEPVYSNSLVPDPTDPNVSGGDPFDLSDLSPVISPPPSWIQYIRITSTGDNWLLDMNGDYVRHTHGSPTWGASGTGNSGFDLDAVAAVNY